MSERLSPTHEVTQADRELEALASLLETESEPSLGILMEQIREFPDTSFDRLLSLIRPDSVVLPRLDLVTAERSVPRMQAALLEWRAGGADLESGMILLARSAYPRLGAAAIRAQLDDLARPLSPSVHSINPRETLSGLVHQMQESYGFHGTGEDYYDPDKTYINRVLETRTGLPISLSSIYMLIGKRIGLDIQGVALPGHFIACLRTGSDTLYFDPYRGGAILSLREVMSLASSTGIAFRPEFLQPPSAPEIVRRMLSNLEAAYGRRHEAGRTELVRQYLSVLS